MKQDNRPKVSVIMATYNCRDTLDEAMESIALQTYENWEVVVCDDASTDNTLSALNSFAHRHPGQVVVLSNDVNSKLAFSLNRCLEHATGEYIARMDGDDISHPRRFEEQVNHLEGHPDVDLVACSMQRFDASGIKDVLTLDPNPNRFSLRRGVPFAHATIMARVAVYRELGGYTVSRRTERGQDRDLWFRFHARGFKGHNLETPLYLVREDSAAMRRRTLRVRWRAYRTTLIGYRMLGYPAHWYIAPTLALAKGLVPYRVIGAYRRWQHRKFVERSRANGTFEV